MFRLDRRTALGVVAGAMAAPAPLSAQTAPQVCNSSKGYPANPDDWANLARYAEDNRRQLATAARPQIVFIGDSITEGWPQKSADFFPAGRVGRGIGGQTTPQMLVRMMADVVALRPRKVHIMGGTNDIAGNTGPIDPAQTRDNVSAMIAIARQHGIDVLLGSIPPAASFPWRPGLDTISEIRNRNRLLSELARTRSVRFVDYTAALADTDGTPRPGMTVDGVHPDLTGYHAMERVLKPHL